VRPHWVKSTTERLSDNGWKEISDLSVGGFANQVVNVEPKANARGECAMKSRRGARLAIREARLITRELRLLGVPSQTIAKIWTAVIVVPAILILGYLAVHYDSGTVDPAVLKGVQITYKDKYQSHVRNSTTITLKSLTVTCYPGGDAQPVTSTTQLYPPLQPGYGEDAYVGADCKLVRVNESHQLW